MVRCFVCNLELIQCQSRTLLSLLADLVSKLESAAKGQDPFKKTQEEAIDEDCGERVEEDEVGKRVLRCMGF